MKTVLTDTPVWYHWFCYTSFFLIYTFTVYSIGFFHGEKPR